MATQDDEPKDENALERILRIATDEPGRRPEFYRTLLKSDVYMIVPRRPGRSTRVPAGSVLEVFEWQRQDGAMVIPFFSSLPMLKQGAPQAPTAVAIPARDFFKAFRTRLTHLNPNCTFGREFVPWEIELLLATSTIGRAEQTVFQEDREVMIEAVPEPPAEMITALITLYAQTPLVEAAYLARVRERSNPERPTLLVALEARGDHDRIMLESSTVVQDTYSGTEMVDMTVMPTIDDGVWADVRVNGTRFYDRSWGCRLMSSESVRST